VDQAPVETEDAAVDRLTQPHGALDDSLEDRLDIGRRAGDDPEDLGGRRLLLERLLRLVEQPDVLDRDDRLGGEDLQELDLPIGERPNFGPPDANRPDGLGPAEQRNSGDRALVSDDSELVAVDLQDRGIEGVAQTGGAPQHRREHGLDVGRGAGDDAQDLGGGGLLIPCLTQGARDLRI
jgi:hypothetical protein